MTALPDIPRLYTAPAECLAVLLVTPALMPRFQGSYRGCHPAVGGGAVGLFWD